MIRYNVGFNYYRGTNSYKISIKWYVQVNIFIFKLIYFYLVSGYKV